MKKTCILLMLATLMGASMAQSPACYTISTFPWEADFSGGIGCWEQRGNGYWTAANAQSIYGQLNSGVTSTGYITITSPVLQFGNSTNGLRLWWKDQRNYMYPNLRVMVLKENGTRDTLYTADMGSTLTQHSVSLTAYANQTVRIAFEVRLSSGGYSYRGTLSQIGIYTQYGPLGTLTVPKVAAVGDSLQAVLNLTRGQAPISYSWHSTMLGDLAGGDTLQLVYPMVGWDTLTVTASNSYDTLIRTAAVRVHDCQAVTAFPWSEDFDGFDTATYNACWAISGWQHLSNGSSMAIVDEDGVTTRYTQLMTPSSSSNGKYMLSPAISIPTVGVEHLRLWVQCRRKPAIRISPTASLDTSDYTDTLCTGANTTVMEWHLFDLSAYAGQTIRVGFFRDGYQANINCVRMDYDLLPVLEQIDAPDRSRTDSTIACSIELRRGALDGLSFFWQSSLTGTTLIDTGYNGTSVFNVTYAIGGLDTITVIAANAYGADTAVWVVEVADCNPALLLPWREDFSYGLGCWYLTENDPYFQWMSNYSGSGNNRNWIASARNSATATTSDAWLVSKAVTIPADTALAVRLFWRVGLSVANNSSLYRVMVSTAADRTDTSAYVELYCDTNLLPGWDNMSQRSVSLAAYAGQTIYIAFRYQPVVRRPVSLLLDDVEVRGTVAPRVNISADRNTYYGDTATFVATIEEGILSGLTYTWHSSLLDSTFAAGDTLRLCYGVWDGWDTVTVVATNAHGADTATVVVRAVYCTAAGIPFYEPFESSSTLACWRKSGYYSVPETGDWRISLSYADNSHHVIEAGTYYSDMDAWLVSPAIDIPTGATGVNLKVKVYGGSSTSSTTYLTILASTTGAADTARFVDTLLHNAYYQEWVTETLPLNAYAGQQIHLAFVHTGVSYYSYGIELDSLSIYYQYQPEVTLSVGDVLVDDTTRYVATINNCVTTGLTYTWHSSLLDTTWIDSSLARISNLELQYSTAGIDTVTFVAANTYGADTATMVVEVIDCTPAVPYTENFEGVTATAYNVAGFPPNCWTASYNGRNAIYMPHVVTTGGYTWISDIPDHALLMVVGIDNGTQAEVVLPRFDDSLQNLSIALDYRYENAGYGTLEVGYYDDTVFTVVDTLAGYAYNYQHDAVNFASATVPDGQIALRWSANDWWAVIIDNITVFNTSSDLLLPHVTLDAPTTVIAYDTVTYTATLQDSSSEGVSITWHSSLLDSTWYAGSMPAVASWELVYPVMGVDTVTVTATNSLGSNSDSRVVTVVGSPQVAISGSSVVSTYDTNAYIANLMAGSTAGLSYTWHSTLQDTTIVTTDSIATIVYTISGTDTLTVVATNLLGSDTATLVVNVTYVPLPGSPVVSLQGYAYATLCDTASFEVMLLEGDTTGLTYTWHSAKADRGEATLHPEGNRLKVAYSAINFDTITVVASNVLGWRTATVTTRVILCEVRDTLPFVATLTEGGSNIYAHFFDWQNGRICYPRGSRFRYNWDGWHPAGIGHHSGRNCMACNGAEWLISPPVHLPDSSSDTLAWNATCYYTTYHLLVSPTEYVVNPDGYIDLSYFTDTLYSETGNSMWNRRTVDLSAYAGNTIHFAFVPSGLASDAAHNNGFYVAIDTVRIWEGENHDTLVGPCPPITVFPWVDTCEHNNPPCWIYANGDDNGASHWYCGGTDSGNYFMRSPLPYGYGNTADNWILTPALSLPVATDSIVPKLSWRTFTNSSNALYEVRISPTGIADTAACTDLIYTESGQSDWSERTVWLDQYAGQTIRIAFRNISTGRPGGGFDYMALDDFRVELVDTLQVPPTPDTIWRTIVILCDSAMGSVGGAGVYEDSSVVAINATPYNGFQFFGWSDGDTNASRTLLLVSDTMLTAYFASISTPPTPPDTVWRSVAVSVSPAGACQPYGSGVYPDSSTVVIGYTAIDTSTLGGHWLFTGWSDGPTDNPRTILVTSDTAIVALFEWVADSVGIGDVQESTIEIYPNPAHGDVTVSVGCPATLSVFDLSGRKVVSPTTIGSIFVIPYRTLPPGVYFVCVTGVEGTTVRKLVME